MTSELTSLAYQLYGRQMILPEMGQAGQEKLSAATVAVIGAGGLGSPALLYLAGAGVGRILIIDDDAVETSNLHRQVIHSYARVGSSKADSAAQTLRELNPLIRVEAVKERLTDANAAGLLAGVDVLVDGSDNFPTRYTASRAAAAQGIPHVWGAILGFDAQMSVFWAGHGPVYEDLYPLEPAPGSVPNCATAGVIGALAGVVGTAMALEVIKLLTGIGQPLMGEVGYYTGLTGRWEYIPLLASTSRAASGSGIGPSARTAVSGTDAGGQVTEQGQTPAPLRPPATDWEPATAEPDQYGMEVTWADIASSPYFEGVPLIDVREPHEHAALAVPGSFNLPLSLIEAAPTDPALGAAIDAILPSHQGRYALYCAAGVRSLKALKLLTDAGFSDLYSVEGGIDSWLTSQG
ncbi:ThiF family adenylyltransferase [Rothia nasisuis]|uniref:ThiF family adenylyltransferase n=1 Tax=Rothia nasisuis TaxID=2109647 RepID=UPI001EFF6B18|nr:ThiF family adenylyltransferase [Rothia nasisuis]